MADLDSLINQWHGGKRELQSKSHLGNKTIEFNVETSFGIPIRPVLKQSEKSDYQRDIKQ